MDQFIFATDDVEEYVAQLSAQTHNTQAMSNGHIHHRMFIPES